MKYIVIKEHASGDEFTKEFDELSKAQEWLHAWYDHLSTKDKRETRRLYLLESANPLPESPGHYDGEIIETAI